MSRLTRDGTAEPVSRDQILRHARGQRNVHFPYSADHEQDWQPYPVDPYSAICDDHTYIHTYLSNIHTEVSNYVLHCFWLILVVVCTTMFLVVFWCACMAITVSVQYNGRLLPDIILLTQCYYHRGTRLNAMKMFCLCGL